MYSASEILTVVSSTITRRLSAKTRHADYDPATWLLIHINDEELPLEIFPSASDANHPFATLQCSRRTVEQGLTTLCCGR